MKNTKEKFVKTINNEELPISKCKKINKEYYKIGNNEIENSGDCYLMGDKKYYTLASQEIFYDHEYKSYVITRYSKNIITGVVGFDENKKPIIGNFTKNKFKNIQIYFVNRNMTLISKDVIFRDNVFNIYREQLSSGNFFHITKLPVYELIIKKIPQQEYKNSLPYDSKGRMSDYIKYYKNNNLEIEESSKVLKNLLKNYTLGLEFETTKGFLTTAECYNNALVPLRDGSISGIEYVTIPLEGEKGVQTIKNAVKILKEKTDFNDKCSLHLHIGNIPRTEEFILAFVVTTLFLQNELFQMFPLYKKYNFGYKNKNYAGPYPSEEILSKLDTSITKDNLIKNFNTVFEFLSEGYGYSQYNNDLNNIKSHPKNPNEDHKWNVNTRYFIHNVIPLIFGNKETIEFRIHTPTYEINKILSFILLNVQIIDYVKNNSSAILKNMRIARLQDILVNNYQNGVEKNLLTDVFYYFKERIQKNEEFYKNSKLFIDEKDIACFIDFNIYKESNFTYKSPFDDNFSTFPIENKSKEQIKKVVKKVIKENIYYIDPIKPNPYLSDSIDSITETAPISTSYEKIMSFYDTYNKTGTVINNDLNVLTNEGK